MELLEIERELAGADREAALARYDAVLVALGERLAETLRTGVAPEEFARCELLAEATTLARKLLRLQVKNESK